MQPVIDKSGSQEISGEYAYHSHASPETSPCWCLGPKAFAYQASLPLLLVIIVRSSLPKDVPSGRTPHSGIEKKAGGLLIFCTQCSLGHGCTDNTNNKQPVKYIKRCTLSRWIPNSTITLLPFSLSIISSSLSLRSGFAL